jgi:hypothetical protein
MYRTERGNTNNRTIVISAPPGTDMGNPDVYNKTLDYRRKAGSKRRFRIVIAGIELALLLGGCGSLIYDGYQALSPEAAPPVSVPQNRPDATVETQTQRRLKKIEQRALLATSLDIIIAGDIFRRGRKL